MVGSAHEPAALWGTFLAITPAGGLAGLLSVDCKALRASRRSCQTACATSAHAALSCSAAPSMAAALVEGGGALQAAAAAAVREPKLNASGGASLSRDHGLQARCRQEQPARAHQRREHGRLLTDSCSLGCAALDCNSLLQQTTCMQLNGRCRPSSSSHSIADIGCGISGGWLLCSRAADTAANSSKLNARLQTLGSDQAPSHARRPSTKQAFAASLSFGKAHRNPMLGLSSSR